MVRVDPIDDTLVVDCKNTSDAAEVRAFEVKAHRFALRLVRVAKRFRLWRVKALAFSALVALAAGVRMTGFGLRF